MSFFNQKGIPGKYKVMSGIQPVSGIILNVNTRKPKTEDDNYENKYPCSVGIGLNEESANALRGNLRMQAEDARKSDKIQKALSMYKKSFFNEDNLEENLLSSLARIGTPKELDVSLKEALERETINRNFVKAKYKNRDEAELTEKQHENIAVSCSFNHIFGTTDDAAEKGETYEMIGILRKIYNGFRVNHGITHIAYLQWPTLLGAMGYTDPTIISKPGESKGKHGIHCFDDRIGLPYGAILMSESGRWSLSHYIDANALREHHADTVKKMARANDELKAMKAFSDILVSFIPTRDFMTNSYLLRPTFDTNQSGFKKKPYEEGHDGTIENLSSAISSLDISGGKNPFALMSSKKSVEMLRVDDEPDDGLIDKKHKTTSAFNNLSGSTKGSNDGKSNMV